MPPGGSAAASPIGTQIAILYEGDGILALNKNAGIAVQEELTPFVRAYLDGKIERSLSFTPGPLHRLDRGASGIIVFGSSLAGARSFSALMQTGLLKKKYLALLEGRLTGAQVWRDNLEYNNAARKTRVYGVDAADDKKNAKYAETCIVPLEYGDGLTVADVEIATGRTHQIRAQAAAHGFPLYGDRKYGSKNPPPFFLHACRLDFPSGCPFPPSITAPPPSAFLDRVKGLTLMV
jgi:23S rRNA pseudouridine955/2504/2580 synthase